MTCANLLQDMGTDIYVPQKARLIYQSTVLGAVLKTKGDHMTNGTHCNMFIVKSASVNIAADLPPLLEGVVHALSLWQWIKDSTLWILIYFDDGVYS